jgi:hypothetical protein
MLVQPTRPNVTEAIGNKRIVARLTRGGLLLNLIGTPLGTSKGRALYQVATP